MTGGPLFINQLYTSNWSTLVSADDNCTLGVQWIWHIMGQCVIDARGMTAVCFGFICIVAWILNGLPQIIENFRTGLPDQAMSPFLLAFWTVGDINSLIGCILTHQLVLQTVVSVYSIGNDCVLIGQFIYYKMKHQEAVDEINDAMGDGYVPPSEEEEGLASSLDDETDHLLPDTAASAKRPGTQLFMVTGILGLAVLSLYPGQGTTPVKLTTGSTATPKFQIDNPHVASGLQLAFLEDTSAKIGYILGCLSGLMYVGSRIPQIFQNWIRGSTEGLCLWLFFLALLGNGSYGLQIFLTSLDPVFLLQSLPWLIGSIGVMLLDILILLQFYRYARRKEPVLPFPHDMEASQSSSVPGLSVTPTSVYRL